MGKQAKAILSRMSLADKVALCSGKNFWETKEMEKYGIPSIFMCDGPHGLRKQEQAADMLGVNESRNATCFPAAVTTGSSWNPELMEEIGRAIGEEAADCGVSLVLGPGANIKRNPLCGRNFEYISEDPYLTGKMAAGLIRGIQANGTGASLKHFALNNQELSRMNSDSVVDERTMREIYLAGFETAVQEGRPATVMCAYNKMNGEHCSDSKLLLTDILRKEWGFDGLVVTDWGAMNDRIQAFRAGCDLNMPGGSGYMEDEVIAAVKGGTLPESAVDECALRVLELVLGAAKQTNSGNHVDAHHALARRAAEEGAVLLKNEDHILPLKDGQKTVLIGSMAAAPRYQGAGSSHINPYQVVSAVDAMKDCAYFPGCDEDGNTTDAMLREATDAARAADIAVVFAGLPGRFESEGFDRETMEMPEGHTRMIEAVVSANPNTVVVLSCGCVVECPWADRVKAILYMGLPGQAGGEAIANLLHGQANPSGKLTESWPLSYYDCPSAVYYGRKNAQYREGVYVGYRYYDKAGIKVRFPFGYGLSYTTFAYSDLSATAGGASVTVTNTGSLAGAEIVQLYVESPQSGIHRPVRELKGFQKVFLEPGESKTVSFTLDRRSFAVWQDGWKVPEGEYLVCVGGLSAPVYPDGEPVLIPTWQKGSWYEVPKLAPTKEQWELLLGRSCPEEKAAKGSFTLDNTVMEMKDSSFVMKMMYSGIESNVSKGFGGKVDYNNPDFKMMMMSSAGGPLRSLCIFGGMPKSVINGMLDMANGHFLRGLKKMAEKK